MVYRNILQRHKNTKRTQNFSPTLYHFENTVRIGLSAYLLIRLSRVRPPPDPPYKSHSVNAVAFSFLSVRKLFLRLLTLPPRYPHFVV